MSAFLHSRQVSFAAPKSIQNSFCFALVLSDTTNRPSDTSWVTQILGLPRMVWDEKEQNRLGVRDMAEKSIRARVVEGARQEKLAFQKVRTVKDWESFRNTRLEALKKWMGPMPERNPLQTTVSIRRNYGDGFVIENIVFDSRPGLSVTANLYLPDRPLKNIPAVVIVHSLHFPKTQLELREIGMVWARAGVATLVMDQLCAGERTQSQPWPREGYYGRYALGNQLYLAGESLIKWMVWDIMRGIDLLVAREEIDPKKIVLVGAVAGGGDPAAITSALDDRVAAVVPFNFGEAGPEEHFLEGKRPYDFETADPGWAYWETTRNLPHSVSEQFFPWFLCVAGAPRHFAYSIEMGWPQSVEEEPAWTRYKKVFELYSAGDHLAELHGFGPFPGAGETNNISVMLRRRMELLLNKWIQFPVSPTEYFRTMPESDLLCMTPSAFRQHQPQPASAVASRLADERLQDARKRLSSLPKRQSLQFLRAGLSTLLGDIEPGKQTVVKKLWKKQHTGFTMEALTIVTDPGITLPLLLLMPDHMEGKKAVALALAEGGKAGFLSSRSQDIAALLSKGIAVCLPDLRAMGEVGATRSRMPGAMGLAANELMLGGTMVGARVKDARTIFRWLSKHPAIDPARIALWGDSFSDVNAQDYLFDQSVDQRPGPVNQHQAEPLGSLLVMLTAIFEEKVAAIAGNGGLVSFSSVLENRFCHIPQDVVVPGLLTVADAGDIVHALAPRRVFLSALVDGRNRHASAEAIKKQYIAQPSLQIADEKGSPISLPDWLAKNLKR